MALPLSKTQVRNLGKRLRDAPTPSPEDLDLLAEVLAAYDEAMVTAADLLSGLGLSPSARLKNTGTVLEKLRRDHATNLHSVQDLAGLRVVVDSGGRRRQDEVVRSITRAFADRGVQVRSQDRRVAPSRGYRAVHLVAVVDGVPVEVQVRTREQHEWAEFFERAADRWGRDIRYPDGQPDVSWLLGRPEGPARARLWREAAERWVERAIAIADLVERIERLEERGTSWMETTELWDDLRTVMGEMLASVDDLAVRVDRLGSDS